MQSNIVLYYFSQRRPLKTWVDLYLRSMAPRSPVVRGTFLTLPAKAASLLAICSPGLLVLNSRYCYEGTIMSTFSHLLQTNEGKAKSSVCYRSAAVVSKFWGSPPGHTLGRPHSPTSESFLKLGSIAHRTPNPNQEAKPPRITQLCHPVIRGSLQLPPVR